MAYFLGFLQEALNKPYQIYAKRFFQKIFLDKKNTDKVWNLVSVHKKAQRTAQPPTLAVYLNPGGVQQELVVGRYKSTTKKIFYKIFTKNSYLKLVRNWELTKKDVESWNFFF
jgi:inosine/xanthosine triphosphate pyrophosphatase family protein